MYLGVDGGGTKTAFVLLDASGAVRATHEAGSSYYIQVSMDEVRRVLEEGVRAVLAKARCELSDIAFAFFGLPAHGEDRENTAALDAMPTAFLPANRYLCGNDMVCGWAGALACADGISVVGGTGSICYGEFNGTVARSGGWGELFSDEGSAYWIARAGLTLFSRMSDNRQPRGPLHYIFKKHLGLSEDIDLCSLIYNEWNQDRDRIAGLSKLVYEAARAGDEQARAIFGRAGEELAELVDATRRSLQVPPASVVPVSYSGGVFGSGEMVIEPFRKALHTLHASYALRTPRFSPGIGAALYAARQSGASLPESALETLLTRQRESLRR